MIEATQWIQFQAFSFNESELAHSGQLSYQYKWSQELSFTFVKLILLMGLKTYSQYQNMKTYL